MEDIKKIVINSPDGQKVYGIEDSEVREELANVVDGAPEELDSFKEAFEKFKEGSDALAAIKKDVARNAEAIAAEAEFARDAEREIKAKALDAATAEFEATENTVALKFATIKGVGDEAIIPAATTVSAGVMSAEDKKVLVGYVKKSGQTTLAILNMLPINIEKGKSFRIRINAESDWARVIISYNGENSKRLIDSDTSTSALYRNTWVKFTAPENITMLGFGYIDANGQSLSFDIGILGFAQSIITKSDVFQDEKVSVTLRNAEDVEIVTFSINESSENCAGVMSPKDKIALDSCISFSPTIEIGSIDAETGKDTAYPNRRRTDSYKFAHYYIQCNDASLIAYLYDKDKVYLGYIPTRSVQESETALQKYPTAAYVRFSFENLTSVVEDGKLAGASVNDLQDRFKDYAIELNTIYGVLDGLKAVSPSFTIGQILSNSGENAASSSRRRTDEYYRLPLSLECSGRNLIIYCYDENKTYLGYIGTVANINENTILARYPNTVYVRLSIIDLTSGVTGFATSDKKSSFSQQLQDLENEVNTKGVDVLSGKKWAVCGDSFTKGDFKGYDGVTSIEAGKYAGKPMTYGYIIGNRCNMEILDNAMGGMTIANPADGTFTNSFTNPNSSLYYQKIPEYVDYITLYYGINDSHHASQNSGTDGEDVTGYIPIGEINDSTNASFYGAWNEALKWLITNRPFAKIGIIVSNGCETPEYRTATIAIARKWGIPFIDLNGDDRTPMMIRSQNPDISSTAKAIRYAAQRVSETNGHPNPLAHEYESTFIESFLRSL